MFMRKMRSSAKWVMGLMALAFAGWLVFDGITAMQGGGFGAQINPVVGHVAGRDIRNDEWSIFLQQELQFRRQGQVLNDEELYGVTEQAWDGLVDRALVATEFNRLGLVITDDEIIAAARTQPPPDMISHPAFQTEGAFDPVKYERFILDPTTDATLLLQLEAYYRELLPRAKLVSAVSQGVYVSEEEAWRFYRDVNETATARYVRVDPLSIPDSVVSVSDAEIEAYYRQNQDEFVEPAYALVNLASVSLEPTAEDTLAAMNRAAELAGRARESDDFGTIATAESDDPTAGDNGGYMGSHPVSVYDPTLVEAVEGLEPGEITDPVRTNAGFHVLQMVGRPPDSLELNQIFVQVEPSGETEDEVFTLIDDLEDIALRSDLTTAGDSVGVEVHNDVRLPEGSSFVIGAGQLAVAVDWALGPEAEIGDLSESFENATGFHLVELLERHEEQTATLAASSATIRNTLLREKKAEHAANLAAEMLADVEAGQTLEEAAASRGWTVEQTEPFGRGDFVPGLGQASEAIGFAFGAATGTLSGVLRAGDASVVVLLDNREDATREEFELVSEVVRNQLVSERAQVYVQKWLAALRETATIEDHRDRLRILAEQAAQSAPPVF